MKTAKKKIRCEACSRRIYNHEPDVVLQKLGGDGTSLHYHTRCADKATAWLASLEEPNAWLMTHRYVDGERN